jgi:N-acylneuraminate cytidylyltransferase
MAIAEFPAPIQRALRVGGDGSVSEFSDAHTTTRTQDLERAFHDIGQLYWGSAAAWLGPTAVVRARTRGYVIPAWRAVDIDTPEDWDRAERVFKLMAAHD